MKVVAFLLALACVASFAWARKAFFRRTGATRQRRGGLGPLGTVWGALSLVVVGLSDVERGSPSGWIAIVGFLASLLLFWLTVSIYRQGAPAIASTAEVPATVVTDGPYKVVRHPFYVAYMLYWFAIPVYARNTFVLIPALILFWLYYRTAREEERAIMQSGLRCIYVDYRRRVGMFFPRLF
jgi:protein-S-isoprenylcysteine O-methyltransferase Ste14